jgi:excinuclease ABC subunit C
LAPCNGKIDADDYSKSVEALQSFLKGDVKQIKQVLQEKMVKLGEDLEFEQAAKIRDQIEAIDIVIEKNSASLSMRDNLDVIGLFSDELEAGVHIFFIRKGQIVGEKIWIVERGVEDSDEALLENVLIKLYTEENYDLPNEIIVPIDISLPVLEMLRGLRGTQIDVHVGKKGDKKRLLERTIENAQENLEIAKRKRTTDLHSRSEALKEIAQYLGLKSPPMRLECYDVSHTMGEFQTGAMVVFEEGLPKKKDYRLFNIKDKRATDDTAAIYEVIMRRLKHINKRSEQSEQLKRSTEVSADQVITEERVFAYFPDLLVIDGGLPQVNSAYRAIQDSGLTGQIQVCSLAKRLEEIWLPALANTTTDETAAEHWPIIMPRDSLGLYLLQHLRDEAHRFSIVSMRKRRQKKFKEQFK